MGVKLQRVQRKTSIHSSIEMPKAIITLQLSLSGLLIVRPLGKGIPLLKGRMISMEQTIIEDM